jgi:hypothetical protein
MIRKYQRLWELSWITWLMLLAVDSLKPKSSAEDSSPSGSSRSEARDRGEDEAEGEEPEEQAIGEAAGDQRAAGRRLSLERHQPDSAAGHVVSQPVDRPLDPRVERERLRLAFPAHHTSPGCA